MLTWMITVLAVTAYCVVRAILDLLRKRYVWSAVGFLCGAALLFAPVHTHAVKLDLPPSNR